MFLLLSFLVFLVGLFCFLVALLRDYQVFLQHLFRQCVRKISCGTIPSVAAFLGARGVGGRLSQVSVVAQVNVDKATNHQIDESPEAQEESRTTAMRLKRLVAAMDMLDSEDPVQQNLHAQIEEIRNIKVRAFGQRVNQAMRRQCWILATCQARTANSRLQRCETRPSRHMRPQLGT